MKTFFQKYLIEIIIIGILISIGLHFFDPFGIKEIFTRKPKISQRVEDTQEYRAIQKDRDKWKDSTAYYKGLHDQIIIDYRSEMNKLPQVATKYNSSIKQVKKMTPVQIDVEYEKYVQIQNNEVQREGEK